MNMKKIFAFIVLSSLIASTAYGKEVGQLKLRSEETARILSLMPLNSPALFYVKRPVRGTIYTILELYGLTLIGVGSYGMIKGGSCSDSSNPDACEGPFGTMNDRWIGAILAGSGFLFWFPPWLHAAIKTPEYVDDCNYKIKEKANQVSLYPFYNVRGDNHTYGAMLQYRF